MAFGFNVFGEVAELLGFPGSAKFSPSIETCHAGPAMRNGAVPKTMLPRMLGEAIAGKRTFREQVFLITNRCILVPF